MRAINVAGKSWPTTVSRLVRPRVSGCVGTTSPKPAVVSVTKLKYSAWAMTAGPSSLGGMPPKA